VFVYIPNDAVQHVLSAFAGSFHECAFLGYDPIRPSDAFGEIMVSNLAAMGAPFVGIHDCPDEASHSGRALACGFHTAGCIDLCTAWDRALDKAELARLQRLEPLDEVEEWKLMMRHYALVGAVKGGGGGASASATAAPAAAAAGRLPAVPHCPAEGSPPASSAVSGLAVPPLAAETAAGEAVGTQDKSGATLSSKHAVLQLFQADELHTVQIS